MNQASGVLSVAAKHGAHALIVALGGSQELGALGAEITSTLLARESRVNERLDAIDRQLEEVLDQRFTADMRAGSRFLIDALSSSGNHRDADLEHARGHLLRAAAAARSHHQRARAERELLLTYLMQRRGNLAARALAEMETAALLSMMQVRVGGYPNLAAAAGADQTSIMLLLEGATFAPPLGLPSRSLDRLFGMGGDAADRPKRWIAISAGDARLQIGPMSAWFSWHPSASPLPPGFSLNSYPTPQGGFDLEAYLSRAAQHRPAVLHLRFEVPLPVDLALKVRHHEGEPLDISTGTTELDVPVGEMTCNWFMEVNSPYFPVEIGFRVPVPQIARHRSPDNVLGLGLLPGPPNDE